MHIVQKKKKKIEKDMKSKKNITAYLEYSPLCLLASQNVTAPPSSLLLGLNKYLIRPIKRNKGW